MTNNSCTDDQDLAALVDELKLEEKPLPSLDDDLEDFWGEAETSNYTSDCPLDHSSELGREWNRRHGHFHTMGYRDGLLAGKESSAQEGFNTGFKESVIVGYNWGLVRGISNAFAALPEDSKDKLVETVVQKERLEKLRASSEAISSNDSLKIFHESISENRTSTSPELFENQPGSTVIEKEGYKYNQLESHWKELLSILEETPKIKATSKWS